MTDKNIQMKHYNGEDWDDLYPVTKTENIVGEDGKNIGDKIDEIIDEESKLTYRKEEPIFYTNLGLYRNAVNQCFRIDTSTNQIIASQADHGQEVEGFFLTQMSPSGQYLSKMEVPEGGHGTNFGVDRVTNGDLKIWVFHEGLSKLVQFEYTPDVNLTVSKAQSLTDFTPSSLVGKKFYVTFDPHHDYLTTFTPSDKKVQIRKREDVRNMVDNVLYEFDADPNEWDDDRPWQGGVGHGKDIYIMSGWGESSSVPIISKYDAEKGEKVESYGLNELYGEDGIGYFRDGFSEPEGLEYYVNPYTKKESLLFCITTGGSLKRYHNVYGFHQRHAETHFASIVRINAQNYAFTHSDGRAFQIKEKWDDLNKIFATGYYYIKDDVFGSMKNKPPYPVGTGGDNSWWLEVKPADQYWTVRQILTRLSYTPKNIQFERTISLDRGKVSDWTLIQSNSLEHPNYATANDWGNQLANIIIPDNYYVTTPESTNFTDHPEQGDSGWWFYVSHISSDGRVEQQLVKNDDQHYRVYRRLVDAKNKSAVTSWHVVAGEESSAGGDPYQIDADYYNGNMNNITTKGEYYVTSTQIGQMSNAPSSYAGWFNVTEASNESASGAVLQTHIRNGNTDYQVSVRKVAKDGSVITDWTMIIDVNYGDPPIGQ